MAIAPGSLATAFLINTCSKCCAALRQKEVVLVLVVAAVVVAGHGVGVALMPHSVPDKELKSTTGAFDWLNGLLPLQCKRGSRACLELDAGAVMFMTRRRDLKHCGPGRSNSSSLLSPPCQL